LVAKNGRVLSGEVADWLRERCDAGLFTTRGLAAELAARGVKTDRRVVWVFLHAEAERDRPDIARKRRLWKARQHRIDPQRLVFIDETWVKTNMGPLRGWGPLRTAPGGA
jgi:hypothetical protein